MSTTNTAVMAPTQDSPTLVLAAGRGTRSGLSLDLSPRLLDEEFGARQIVRFEDIDFPPALAHEPTRRFLREVGLPENGVWLSLDMDIPLPTVEEYCADEHEDGATEFDSPEGADRLIRLGHLLDNTSLVVDGDTGAVLRWYEPTPALRPLNADVAALAFVLLLAHREQWRPPAAVDRVREVMEAVAGIEPAVVRDA
jgi:hypothetical protein